MPYLFTLVIGDDDDAIKELLPVIGTCTNN